MSGILQSDKQYPVKLGFRTLEGTTSTMYSNESYPLRWSAISLEIVRGETKHGDRPVCVIWLEDGPLGWWQEIPTATADLLEQIDLAVADYRRIFPEPCALAPNLDLACRARAEIIRMMTTGDRS